MYFQRITPKRHVLMNQQSDCAEFITKQEPGVMTIRILGPLGGKRGEVLVHKQDFIKMVKKMKEEGDLE